ncbi:alpha/beta fold hydrolase [Streptomyces sp. NPDC055036]
MQQVLAVEYVRSTASSAGTAVFLHGLGGWTHNWARLTALMRTSEHCLAIDLPGFGRSAPPPDGKVTVERQAAAVIGHLEQTGHRRVHLVGNSLGGLVALRIAAQRPDLVRTLTLISPVLPALPPAQALRVALLSLPGIPRLHSRLLAAQSTDRQLDDLHRLIYAHPTHVSREHRTIEARERERRAELPYAQEMLSEGVRAVVRAFLSQGEGATWRQARGVTAPTLLVYGREDRLVPFRSAHRAYAAFRDARLLIVPGAGHVAMQEQPGPVAMAIRGLITEADRELATAGDFSIDAVRTSAVKASALHTAQGQT